MRFVASPRSWRSMPAISRVHGRCSICWASRGAFRLSQFLRLGKCLDDVVESAISHERRNGGIFPDKVVIGVHGEKDTDCGGRQRLVFGAVGLTQVLGVPQVLAGLAAKHFPQSQEVRRSDQHAECDAVAVAPFVVKATYSWHLERLLGQAGTVFYAWLPGAVLEVWAPSPAVE